MRIAIYEAYGSVREQIDQAKDVLLANSARYEALVVHNSLNPLFDQLDRKFSVVHCASPELEARLRGILWESDIVPIKRADAPLHLWGSDEEVANKVIALVGNCNVEVHHEVHHYDWDSIDALVHAA